MSRRHPRRLAAIAAACCALSGIAGAQVTTFDPASSLVTIPSVSVGGATYVNVTLRHQGNYVFALQDATYEALAGPGVASYDVQTRLLTIPAVRVGETTYVDVVLLDTGNFSFALQAATELSPATLNAVKSLLGHYDGLWVGAPPASGALRVALLDACFLDSGSTRAYLLNEVDADPATFRASQAYQVGRRSTNLQVLALRNKANVDGSTREEIDVQYDIEYTDGSVQTGRTNTLIRGDSSGTPGCAGWESGSYLRFLGNQQLVQTSVRARNTRDHRRSASTGAQLAPAVNYRRSVGFFINDPLGNATYAVMTGPGPTTTVGDTTLPFSLKFISPRLLRSVPELAGKNGNFLNWLDDDNWRYCRIEGSGVPVATLADCAGQGATSTEWGPTVSTPSANADQSFDSQGWVAGGTYRFDVYNDDGWKTVNGQAGKTPIATYYTKLESLPYTFVEMAGGASGDKFPKLGFGTLSYGQVASNANKAAPATLDVSWSAPAALSDQRRFVLAQGWEFNNGPKVGNAAGTLYPGYRNLLSNYPGSRARSNPAWATLPKLADQASKNYFEYTLQYTDRTSAQIISVVSFQ